KNESESKKLAKRFEKIVNCLADHNSMYEFLKNTGDDVELLTDWYVFNLYEDSSVEEKSESVTNNILRSIAESDSLKGVSIHIEKDDGLQNDSSLDIDTTLDLWNKRFTHFPIDIDDEKFGYEDSEKNNIFFSSKEQLFIPPKEQGENKKGQAIEAWLYKGLEMTNLILQNRKIPKYEMEYFQMITKMGIKTQDKNTISQLRVFLKYCLDRNSKLSTMYANADNSTQLLEDYASGKAEKDYINVMNIDGNDSKIGENKAYFGAFKKLIKAKRGNLRKITDLSRMMNTYDNFTDAEEGIHKFLNYIHKSHEGGIEAVSIDEYTGNYMRKGEKKTGYRDLNLLVKLKGEKNPIEVQFHYREIAKWKQKGRKFSSLVSLYKDHGIKFTQKDVEQIEASSYLNNGKLPKGFQELCTNGVLFTEDNKESHIKGKISSGDKTVTADYFYNLTEKGEAHMNKSLHDKLKKMEYLPNADAMGKTRAEEYSLYIESQLEKIAA
ncbi:hypothetical protein LR004_01695, partial [Candidatus Gracilibacteria bacterium]|nr:hypothetical protein [Candidatus Gracilibacteria bacterium]